MAGISSHVTSGANFYSHFLWTLSDSRVSDPSHQHSLECVPCCFAAKYEFDLHNNDNAGDTGLLPQVTMVGIFMCFQLGDL